MFSTCLHLSQGNLKGKSIVEPSYHHLWRRVIVPSDFFIAKPPSNFVKHELPFLHGFKSCKHRPIGAPNDCAKSRSRYNNSTPYVTIKMAVAP